MLGWRSLAVAGASGGLWGRGRGRGRGRGWRRGRERDGACPVASRPDKRDVRGMGVISRRDRVRYGTANGGNERRSGQNGQEENGALVGHPSPVKRRMKKKKQFPVNTVPAALFNLHKK